MLSGIPLPRVVADTGPGGNIVTGELGANALTRSNLENQFYAPAQQADIALKQIQAQYMPAQLLAQVLSNPSIASIIPGGRDAIAGLADKFGNAINNPLSMGSYGKPSSTFGQQALSWLANKIMGKDDSSSNQAQNPLNQIPTGSVPSNAVLSARAIPSTTQPTTNALNNTNDLPASAYPNGVLPSSTINRAQDKLGVPGSAGGTNPVAVSHAQSAGLDTTATTEAAAQQQSWQDIYDTDRKQAFDAQNNLNNLDKMVSNYDQLGWWEKGFPFGAYGPAVTSAAQNLDTFSKALGGQVAQQNVDGHVTDKARDYFLGIKPNRGMNKEAFHDNVNFARGMNKRLLELPAFDNLANAKGLTPDQRTAVWTYYNNQEPFYAQTKDGRTVVADDNLNRWKEYLSDENIKKALSGKDGKPSYKMEFGDANDASGSSDNQTQSSYKMWPEGKEALNENELQGQASPPGTQWWIRPDGMKVPVHSSQVEIAKKLNYRKVG